MKIKKCEIEAERSEIEAEVKLICSRPGTAIQNRKSKIIMFAAGNCHSKRKSKTSTFMAGNCPLKRKK